MIARAESQIVDEVHELRVVLTDKVAHLLTPESVAILKCLEIRLSHRMRTALGRASYARMAKRRGRGLARGVARSIGPRPQLIPPRIELNARMLLQHPEEVAPTFAHELAHVIAPLVYGREGLNHQSGWRKIMECFGYAPERTHNLDVGELRRDQKPVAFAACACPGREHPIKARRYRKMRYGRTRYICLQCHAPLKLRG